MPGRALLIIKSPAIRSSGMRLLLALLFALISVPAAATTLQEALAHAYHNNPDLEKERVRLKAIDEQVPLAKSGARPSVDADAFAGHSETSRAGANFATDPRGLSLQAIQPIYKGGRIDAAIHSAESAVRAGRADLQGAEQTLFLNAATAYLDVWRDQAVVKLNKKNEQVLGQELKAAKDRLEVGEATRTDRSQAESRLSGANASRIESEGRLAASRAAYARIIGMGVNEITAPKINFNLPENLAAAIDAALAHHPRIIAARHNAAAAGYDADAASGALLPEVNVEASAGRNWDQSFFTTGETDNAQALVRLTVPLYRAGADYARTRAAKETASQRLIELRSAQDNVRENTVRAWEGLTTTRATIKARRKQVEAAGLALEGVRQESEVGTRTVLDRLNAEAEALQSRVDLVQAERDEVVAMFELKTALGELTAPQIGLMGVTPYNPEEHYNETKDAWIGLGPDVEIPPASQPETSVPVPAATPPASLPAKPPAVSPADASGK